MLHILNSGIFPVLSSYSDAAWWHLYLRQ